MILFVLKLREHVNESCLVWSVVVDYPDFLVAATQKAFHTLVPHVGVLFHLLCPVDGGSGMDGRDGIIQIGDYCFCR